MSHGAFPLGELIASVYSSRRETDNSVTLSVGRAAVRLDIVMTASQARAMARVFEVAARAAEDKAEDAGSAGATKVAAFIGQRSAS